MHACERRQTLDVLPSAGETLGPVDGRHISYNDVHADARNGIVGKPDDHDAIDQIVVAVRKSRRSSWHASATRTRPQAAATSTQHEPATEPSPPASTSSCKKSKAPLRDKDAIARSNPPTGRSQHLSHLTRQRESGPRTPATRSAPLRTLRTGDDARSVSRRQPAYHQDPHRTRRIGQTTLKRGTPAASRAPTPGAPTPSRHLKAHAR